MVRSPAIATLFAVIALCACAEAASAKNARARQPAASRATGQTILPKKPPLARTPAQDEKSWMERASAPSSSGGGGGGM